MPDVCPLCGSTQARELFRALRPRPSQATGLHTEDLFGRAGRLVRCSGCTLVRQEDPPTAPYEDAATDPEYLVEERGIRRTFGELLERIERHRSPPGRLLDAGCGPGFLLEEARSRGWQAVGVEPSGWGVDQARQRGLDVTHGTLETAELDADSFDAIVAADVIEHVPHPLVFAERMHELLRPGGIVVVATPNVEGMPARVLRRWWWSVIPNHLWLFSPRTLDALLRRAGFEPLVTTTHPKTFSIEYYAGRFAGYSKLLGTVLRRASRAFGGRGRLVRPDLGDRVAILATKPSRP